MPVSANSLNYDSHSNGILCLEKERIEFIQWDVGNGNINFSGTTVLTCPPCPSLCVQFHRDKLSFQKADLFCWMLASETDYYSEV